MLFEINAALDHISRIWIYSEQESEAIDKAYGHLKRSCLDVFKILVKQARDHYGELLALDTSTLDNGDFDKQLHQLWHRIKCSSTEARRLEGQPDGDRLSSFDRWQDVAEDCLTLEKQFLLHPNIEWARRRAKQESLSVKLTRWSEGIWLTTAIYFFAMPDRITISLVVFGAFLFVLARVLVPPRQEKLRSFYRNCRTKLLPSS